MLVLLHVLPLLTEAVKVYKLPSTGSGPYPRTDCSGVLDSVDLKFWLFSGMTGTNEYLDDLWTFDYANYKWTEVVSTTTSRPSNS
jgi:hypothetical protein